MKEFKYSMVIEADDQDKAGLLADAIMTIYKNIDKEHLTWVSDKIKEDPKVIEKVIKIADNPFVKKLFLS